MNNLYFYRWSFAIVLWEIITLGEQQLKSLKHSLQVKLENCSRTYMLIIKKKCNDSVNDADTRCTKNMEQ